MEGTVTSEATDSNGCLRPIERETTVTRPLPESSFRAKLIDAVHGKLQKVNENRGGPFRPDDSPDLF